LDRSRQNMSTKWTPKYLVSFIPSYPWYALI